MVESDSVQTDEAREALEVVQNMRIAGLTRAVPPRWYGIGISLTVGIGFALYAQEDPGISVLVIVLGTVLFGASSREKIGVQGKAVPDTKSGRWALVAVSLFLVTLFFGGIFVRRAYDLAWVPLVTGLVAGVTIFLLTESERRHYLPKTDNGAP